MYSTATKVRDEAGFTGNNNILDATITSYIDAATNHIDGKIGRLYSLPLASTPPIIELIERKLAAGYLMLDEYGTQAEGTSKDGNANIRWAEGMLESIEKGLVQLVNSSGVVLSQINSVGMMGMPLNSTGTDKTEEGSKDNPPIFEVGQEF